MPKIRVSFVVETKGLVNPREVAEAVCTLLDRGAFPYELPKTVNACVLTLPENWSDRITIGGRRLSSA